MPFCNSEGMQHNGVDGTVILSVITGFHGENLLFLYELVVYLWYIKKKACKIGDFGVLF